MTDPVLTYIMMVTLPFGIIVMMAARLIRWDKDTDRLIHEHVPMKVVSPMKGEYVDGTKSIAIGTVIQVTRKVDRMLMCREQVTGKLFLLRKHTLTEAYQEGRIQEHHA